LVFISLLKESGTRLSFKSVMLFGSAVIFLAAIVCVANYRHQKNHNINPQILFDQRLYTDAISRYGENPDAKIAGAVFPHHDLAGFMVAEALARFPADTKTVILIGPNHPNIGNFNVITGVNFWATPDGKLEADENIISQLTSRLKFVGQEEDVLSSEHSIGAIVPYIKHYLPDAKIVPLILNSHISEREEDELAFEIASAANGTHVVVASSVDFSHGLLSVEASQKDSETIEKIKEKDYTALSFFTNDHLDSPASIITLLRVMEQNKKENLEILGNTNSGELLKEKFIQVTSYFSILFYGN